MSEQQTYCLSLLASQFLGEILQFLEEQKLNRMRHYTR